jgi:hypothetical protein
MFRILHYSIQMQMREVGTKYLIKTWSWTKPANTKGRVRQILSSEAHDRHALFTPQGISRNLAVSYDLGPGMRKEVSMLMYNSETVLNISLVVEHSDFFSFPFLSTCVAQSKAFHSNTRQATMQH